MAATPTHYVACKIGGSLLTDKARVKTPNRAAIAGFARSLLALPAETRRRLILLAGGGSFGSALQHPDYAAKQADLGVAALAAFEEWAALLGGAWRAEGFDCEIITADRLFRRRGHRLDFEPSAMLRCLARGATPVVMGGYVPRGPAFRIVSSDVMALYVARVLPVSRFAALTNVPGVIVNGAPLRRLSEHERARARRAASNSAAPDATGGMRLKLNVMLRLADLGVEGVICSGEDPAALEAAIRGAPPPGTHILPRQGLKAAAC